MQKIHTHYVLADVETKAQELIHLTFMLCEQRIKSCKGTNSPEVKTLAAAALSLEKAILTYIAAERLFE